MTEQTIIEVYAENLPTLEAKIVKINNKAAKFGFPPVSLKVLRSFEKTERIGEFPGRKVVFKMVEVEVVGETPMIEGWTLAAIVSPVEAGVNMLRVFPGFEIEIPVEYRSVGNKCDHCGKARNRHETFILWNEAEGFKQVGRQCLADFTGNNNPHHAAWVASFMKSLRELGDDEEIMRAPAPQYMTRDFMANVVASIRAYGWVSRSAAWGDTQSTANHAAELLIPREEFEKPHKVQVVEADYTKADVVIDWVRNVVAKRENLNTFMYNMVISVSDESINHTMYGFAAYSVVAYDKEGETEIVEKLAVKPSQHVGTVGKRQQFNNLTVTYFLPMEGDYGITYFMKFMDTDGNVYVWRSSSAKFEVGQVVSGEAAVKSHDEYKGIPQTTITRAKFAVVEVETA